MIAKAADHEPESNDEEEDLDEDLTPPVVRSRKAAKCIDAACPPGRFGLMVSKT